MRVLILSEGATDLGQSEPGGTQTDGVLPVFVRRLLTAIISNVALEVTILSLSKVVRRFPKAGITRSTYGYANKLAALPGLKMGREADAIVAVVDRDGERYATKIDDLNRGRDELRRGNKPCAVGVAIEIIEAWLLADEMAMRSVLGYIVDRQPEPENLASRDLNSGRHPKSRLRQLIRGSPTCDSLLRHPDIYAAIATAIDITILEQRCPQGFRPFAQQVRELALSN